MNYRINGVVIEKLTFSIDLQMEKFKSIMTADDSIME